MSAFRSAGIRPLFVPSYSPEFNAIENIFSMLKRQYRTTYPINAEEANAFDYNDALHTIMNAHDKSTLHVDFSGYFRHVANVSNNALLLIHQHCLNPQKNGD
jgi:hypothetical protein